MQEHAIETSTHGRYLADLHDDETLVVGFHGYGESADVQFERLRACRGGSHWSLVSIQGLHRFYQRRPSRQVVASWMTSQDRERAIADNAAYVAAVLARVRAEQPARVLCLVGFSQGVSMAFRAAVAVVAPGVTCHVAAVGGDVPPELGGEVLARLGSVLLCRGRDDGRYGPEAFEQDRERLGRAGVPFEAAVVPGAHEWSPGVADAVGGYLRARVRPFAPPA